MSGRLHEHRRRFQLPKREPERHGPIFEIERPDTQLRRHDRNEQRRTGARRRSRVSGTWHSSSRRLPDNRLHTAGRRAPSRSGASRDRAPPSRSADEARYRSTAPRPPSPCRRYRKARTEIRRRRLPPPQAVRRRATPRPALRTPSPRAPQGRSSPEPTAAGTDPRPTAEGTTWSCSPSASTSHPMPRSCTMRIARAEVGTLTHEDELRPDRLAHASRRSRRPHSTRFTGRKFDRWMISLSYLAGGHSRARRSGSSRRRCSSHSRKFGMTRISRLIGERLIRLETQAVGHRGHTVGLIDREGDGFRVGRVAAEQRDIGTVKRRDDPRDLGIRSGRGRRR